MNLPINYLYLLLSVWIKVRLEDAEIGSCARKILRVGLQTEVSYPMTSFLKLQGNDQELACTHPPVASGFPPSGTGITAIWLFLEGFPLAGPYGGRSLLFPRVSKQIKAID